MNLILLLILLIDSVSVAFDMFLLYPELPLSLSANLGNRKKQSEIATVQSVIWFEQVILNSFYTRKKLGNRGTSRQVLKQRFWTRLIHKILFLWKDDISGIFN